MGAAMTSRSVGLPATRRAEASLSWARGGTQQARGIGQERLHELAVGFLVFGRLPQAGGLHAAVADRLHAALIADDPHQPRDGTHGLENPIEHATEHDPSETSEREQRLDLADEAADLRPGLFDGLGIDGAHGVPTRWESAAAYALACCCGTIRRWTSVSSMPKAASWRCTAITRAAASRLAV